MQDPARSHDLDSQTPMKGDDRNRRCRNPQIRGCKPPMDSAHCTPLGSTRNGNPSYIKVAPGFGKFLTRCCAAATARDQVALAAYGRLTNPASSSTLASTT